MSFVKEATEEIDTRQTDVGARGKSSIDHVVTQINKAYTHYSPLFNHTFHTLSLKASTHPCSVG